MEHLEEGPAEIPRRMRSHLAQAQELLEEAEARVGDSLTTDAAQVSALLSIGHSLAGLLEEVKDLAFLTRVAVVDHQAGMGRK